MSIPTEFINNINTVKEWIGKHEIETGIKEKEHDKQMQDLWIHINKQTVQLSLINQNLKWINAGVMIILGGMASLIFKVFGG